jgi:large subunit ribosomal protein L15
MRLNTLKPAEGSQKECKRVGRGIGSGLGKTCGRGHKGQKSRSGGFHKVGFEGGQMPLQRRLPKVGFNSRKARITAELTLNEIASIGGDIVDMQALYEADILPRSMKRAKVILSGEISVAKTVKGIRATRGAREAIEKAGGSVED